MTDKLRIFIDYWNLQLNWNERTDSQPLDWEKLPAALKSAAEASSGISPLQYEGSRLYASYDPANPRQGPFRGWLDSYVDRIPGYNVTVLERRSRRKPIHCRECDTKLENCPECNRPFMRSPEKGVDAAIITDLFSLAWENAYATAILVTSDRDFVPAVANIQDRGFKIVNATWKDYGHQLAKACWASFEIDSLITQLIRHNPPQ